MYMERYYETVIERNHHRDDNANEDEGEAWDKYEKRWMKALVINDGNETFLKKDDEEFSDVGFEGDLVDNDAEREDMKGDKDAIDGGLGGLSATVED